MLVHPELVRAVGLPGAVLLGQLLYWSDKARNTEAVFKTLAELERETGLSRSQQETAIRRCVRLRLLTVTVRDVPARRHFAVNQNAVFRLSGSPESSKPVCRNPANWNAAFPQTPSESTQESTTESTSEMPSSSTRNREALDRTRADLISRGVIRPTRPRHA